MSHDLARRSARGALRAQLSLLPASGVAGVLLLSCMAAPPREALAFDGGVVRAEDAAEAQLVGALLDELRPALLELLPDADFADLEVWVQERPTLYRSPLEATADAEGLWSPTHRRILLGRNADHLRRTLAHELTHAALGASWSRLPGTIEEGLADQVSARLAPDGAARLSAGRLSSAALACGGLELEVEVVRRSDEDRDVKRGWSARVRLTGDVEGEPLDVFRLAAGLSSTDLESGSKRGYYGLAYLVVGRVVDRIGFAGLQALCERARADGHSAVPRAWLLEAAELDAEPDTWRRAAVRRMGEEELVELVRMYPDFLVDGVVTYLETLRPDGDSAGWIDAVDVRVRLVEGTAGVGVERLPFVRDAIVAALTTP